ncbi:hypothetical protein HDU93_004895, partial [Gonapodya sp. JEL0774]
MAERRSTRRAAITASVAIKAEAQIEDPKDYDDMQDLLSTKKSTDGQHEEGPTRRETKRRKKVERQAKDEAFHPDRTDNRASADNVTVPAAPGDGEVAETKSDAADLAAMPQVTNIDAMPVEVLACIVDFVIKTPVLVARLSQLNRNMHFLIGGLPLWRDMGVKMKLPPPNPRATKYRTWLSVVGREGARLCHWCFKRAPQADFLRFPHDGLWAKLCGDCRATKWEAEKQRGGKKDDDNSFLPSLINKGEAKQMFHLTDSDLAALDYSENVTHYGAYRRVVEHMFKETDVLELARRRWGGDEGIQIRGQQLVESLEIRKRNARERDEERCAEIRTFFCARVLEKLREIRVIIEESPLVNPTLDADADISDHEWELLVERSTAGPWYMWISAYQDEKCFAPESKLKPMASKKRIVGGEDSNHSQQKRRAAQHHEIEPEPVKSIVSWMSARLLRFRLISESLRKLGYEAGCLEPVVVIAAWSYLKEFMDLSMSFTSLRNTCSTPDETDIGIGVPVLKKPRTGSVHTRNVVSTTVPDRERKAKYVDAVKGLPVADIASQIHTAVGRMRMLAEHLWGMNEGLANTFTLRLALGGIAVEWMSRPLRDSPEECSPSSEGEFEKLLDKIKEAKVRETEVIER